MNGQDQGSHAADRSFTTPGGTKRARRLSACTRRTGPESTELLVFLHAFQGSAARFESCFEFLKESGQTSASDIYAPDLPFGLWSRAHPSKVVLELLGDVSELVHQKATTGAPYRSIVFVGHSIGGLFARKLYLVAMGESEAAPFEAEFKRGLGDRAGVAADWANLVRGIILLAGINRGWTISHHMSIPRGIAMSIGLWVGRLLRATGMQPFIVMSSQKGAPFITQLRLQWVALEERCTSGKEKMARIVQLLGTQDDLVPPSDNVDPVTGRGFAYVEVPYSGHANVVDMSDAKPDSEDPGPKARQAAVLTALKIVRGDSAVPDYSPPDISFAPQRDESVGHVVFVIHGIRDLGYWTQKIGTRVASRAGGIEQSVALETSTYGYFPLLSFLRPGARQQKVEWLMDRYTQAKATYPCAQFSYVGHSHGTYLFWKALADYPAVRFDRAVLAGSVLRSTQKWGHFFDQGRIGKLVNLAASRDWVVAFFPNAMQMVGWQDVGGAGHYGFQGKVQPPGLEQLRSPMRYALGGHGAAVKEQWWDIIAEFIVTGNFVAPTDKKMVRETHSWWVALGAAVAPLIWVGIATGLFFGLYGLAVLCLAEWMRTLLIVGYVSSFWFILTRV